MRYRIPILLAAAQLLHGQSGGSTVGGTIPRSSSGDYPTHVTAVGLSAGAVAVPAADSRRILGRDINRAGYIVIEIAIYPESGQIELNLRDFSVRLGSASVGAVWPDTIIASMQPPTKPPKLPENISVYTSETIGYESGGRGNGRGGGGGGGVYTASQVGVGVNPSGAGGPPRQQGNDTDLTDFRRQLEAKQLPETKTSSPIAGYLYFPRPASKQKPTSYEVVYEAPAGQVRLTVPIPSSK